MERAHYPWADENVERIKGEIERQNEIAQYQRQIAQMQTEIENRAGYAALLAENMSKGGGQLWSDGCGDRRDLGYGKQLQRQ